MRAFPKRRCVIAAVVTPVDPDLRPDAPTLVAFCRHLMEQGCDGIALFGTTGEGAMFGGEDRRRTLDALLTAGFDPDRLVVATGALNLPEAVRLAQHATDCGVAGVMLMPPCFYRS